MIKSYNIDKASPCDGFLDKFFFYADYEVVRDLWNEKIINKVKNKIGRSRIALLNKKFP